MTKNEFVVSGQIANLKLPRATEVEQFLSQHPRCSFGLRCHLKSLLSVVEDVIGGLDRLTEQPREIRDQDADVDGDGAASPTPAPRVAKCPQARFLVFDKNIARVCGVKTAIFVENISQNVARQLQCSGNHASVCDVSVSFSQKDISSYLGFGREAVRQAVRNGVASGYITTSPGSHCGQLRYRLTQKSAYRALGGASSKSLWCVRVGDLGVMKDWAATVLYGFRARIRTIIEEGQYPHDGRYFWVGSVQDLYKTHYEGRISRRNLDRIIKDLLEAGRLVRTLCDRNSGTYEWAMGGWDENDLLWEMTAPRNGKPHTFLDHQFVRPLPWESFNGAYPPWANPIQDSAGGEDAE